jgi:diphthine synthase
LQAVAHEAHCPFSLTSQAVEQLLEVEAARGQGACARSSRAVGIARLGAPDQQIVAGALSDLQAVRLCSGLGMINLIVQKRMLCSP